VSLEMHLDAEIKLNSVMHFEAVLEGVRRCIRRPRSSNSEMHMEVMIEQDWRCTWRPRSS